MGDELTIEPGTIIKGTGSGAEASALIVARGGKINAVGTQENPIVLLSNKMPWMVQLIQHKRSMGWSYYPWKRTTKFKSWRNQIRVY